MRNDEIQPGRTSASTAGIVRYMFFSLALFICLTVYTQRHHEMVSLTVYKNLIYLLMAGGSLASLAQILISCRTYEFDELDEKDLLRGVIGTAILSIMGFTYINIEADRIDIDIENVYNGASAIYAIKSFLAINSTALFFLIFVRNSAMLFHIRK